MITNRMVSYCKIYINKSIILLFLIGFSLPVSTALQNVLMIILCGITLFKKIYLNNIWKVKKNATNLLCILLYILFIVRSLHSDANFHQIAHRLTVFAWAIYLPILYIYMRTHYQNHKYLLYGIIFGTIISLIVSYLSWIFNYPVFHGRKFGDWANHWAPFRSHFIHCMFLAILSAWALFNIIQTSITKKKQIIYLLLIISSAINVYYLIPSITGQFIFATAIAITLLNKNFKKGAITFGLIVIIVLPILITTSDSFKIKLINGWKSTIEFQHDKIPTRINTGKENNSSLLLRLNYYNYSWQLIKQKIWFGYGTGSFSNEYKQITNNNSLIATNNPHSDYLLIFMELGIFGVFLLCSIFVTIFYYSLFYLNGFERLLGLIVTISYGLSCVFNPWLSDSVVGISFASMSAFVIIHFIKNFKYKHYKVKS